MLSRRLRKQSPLTRKSSQSNNALGFRGTGHGIVEAVNDALLAQHDHGVEEGWSDSLADDGHARGVNQQSRLYAPRLGHGAGGVIAPIGIPFLQISQRLGW